MNTVAIDDLSLVPLTFPQYEIWSDQMLHHGSALYNIGGYMRITGPIDPHLFQEAVQRLVCKHDALRTVLVANRNADGVPMQRFAPDMPVSLSFVDLSQGRAPQQAALDWMRKRFSEPFFLQGEPLFRYALLKLAPDSFYFFACYHHLIADGWSVALLTRSIAAIYTALETGSEFDACAPSYLDFVENDRAYARSPTFEAQRQYWLGKFQSPPEPLLAARRTLAQDTWDTPAECSTLSLPRQWYDRIGELAQRYGGTTFHAIIAALYVYFTRTAQRDELVMGLPVLNRANAALKATAGMFVGVTASRFKFGRALSFGDLLRSIGRELKQNYRHQRFPLSHLNRDVKRFNGEQSQLFDIGLSYGRHDYEVSFGQAGGTAIHMANEHLAHPLMLYVWEFHEDEPVQLDFVFNKAYFQKDEIQALAQRLLHILNGALEAPDTPVCDLSLLVPHEMRQIESWNSTRREHDGRAKLLEGFDTQVRMHGDRVAVAVGGNEITYGELDARANRLARYLRSCHDVGPDMLVGLFLERSIDMVVGILGALKAGAAYLPLDPAYPVERLQRTLEDARPSVLLSQLALAARLPHWPAAIVFLDSDWEEIAMHAAHAVTCPANADNLAYVIYTSGSTGKPKGVAVSRANLLHLMRAQDAYFPDPVERFLMTWSFAFDGSVFCIFWTLSGGGTLFLATEQEHNDVAAAMRLIERQAITHLLAIPSFHALLLEAADPWQLASLSTVMVAGEACGADLVKQHFSKLPQACLLNGYGPTEGSVWSTVYRCHPAHDAGSVPIGKPIENMQVHVLDEYFEPVPVGVAGDIYISGEGVTRGYLHNAILTAEKFLPCPFADQPGARMYKTGDLGRWTPDGNLEFLGRTDHQVKVRGFRIELTDIEAALLAQPAVREAAVLLHEETLGDQRLAAYVVMYEHAIDKLALDERMAHRIEHDSGTLSRERLLPGQLDAKVIRMLKQGLERSLPRHMMPHHFVLLKDMPHTPNGKIDRKALPSPRPARAAEDYVAPCTPVESALAEIWADLLKVERVGRHHNFFDLGGHSLLAMALIQRMRKQGLQAEVRMVFAAPTLAELAAATQRLDDGSAAPPNRIWPQCTAICPDMLALVALSQEEIDRIVATVPGGAANIQDIYPIGPEQEGLLLHHRTAFEGDAYLMPALFALDGRERLVSMLHALQSMIDRHDVLRTAMLWEGLPQPVQVVLRQVALPVEMLVLDPADDGVDAQLMARFATRRSRMDVRQAPLLRAIIAHDAVNNRWLLMLLTHHLVFDQTSLNVLATELSAHMAGHADALPEPPPYRNYIAQTKLAARRPEHEVFFRRMLGDVHEPTIPFGVRDVAGNGVDIIQSRRAVDAALTARLRRQGRALGVSVASLCHLAWAWVLAHATQREDVVFGTVLFGRLHGDGVDRAMGLYVNTLPLRVQLGSKGIEAQVREVHALLAELLQHEHAPLSLAERCSAVPAPVPLFTALLNYRYSDKSSLAPGTSAWPGIDLLWGEERTHYPVFLSIDDYGEHLSLAAQTTDAIGPSRLCDFMHTALEQLVQALEIAPGSPPVPLIYLC